jgi:anthranilate phosphoribosyltransferase
VTAVERYGGWQSLLSTICDGRDLQREQASAAMTDMLNGDATPAQIAGLIVGLRMKGETVEEMTGLAGAMLDAAEPLTLPPEAVDIVGTGGSPHRRAHALNVSTMACIVAAAAGVIICKHGNRKASSTSGSFDFLEALGIGIDLDGAGIERCIDEVGIAFAFARAFHPAMRHAGPVRSDLGIPTVFNVLGPLAHPGRIKRQVVGTADEDLAAKMAPVLKNLGTERTWVVTGSGGLDELTVTDSSVVYDVSATGIERFEVTPEDVGLPRAGSANEIAGGSAEENAAIFRAILDGSEIGPRRDVVVLNAAAGLCVAGVTDDLRDGVELATAVVADGRAGKKLAALVAATGGH